MTEQSKMPARDPRGARSNRSHAMTNPDREELAVKLAGWIDSGDLAIIHCHPEGLGALDASQEQRDLIATALRRLASSEDGVKVRELEWVEMPDRDPESASWIAETDLGRSYRVFAAWWGAQHKYGYVFDGFYHTEADAKAAAQADYEARIRSALVEVPAVKGEPEPVALSASERACYLWPDDTEQARACRAAYIDGAMAYAAPPADAGMREALANLLAYAERNECPHESTSRGGALWTICDDCGRKWADDRGGFKPYVEPAEITAARAALTAPGATTKSDGGAKAGSSPILASKEDQRSNTHGMMPVGDNAANVGSTEVGPSDPSPTRSERWVCAARQRGITLDPQDCDWPVCGCDPLANKVLDTITESGFVIVPKDGAPMTDDQIKHMVDRFLDWTLPENFNPDGGVSFKRLENRHHHPDASPFYPMPVGTNLFDATEATAMVRHMLEGLPSTRSDVTVESLAVWLFDNLSLDASHEDDARALLDQFEIRRK